MTLRELGSSISDWFSQAYHAVTSTSVVDWPLSVLFLVAVPVCALVAVEIGYQRDKHKLRRLADADAARWRSIYAPADMPSDPVERLEWANRTGRYAPPDEKGR